MKKITFLILFVILDFASASAQLPTDYPFKILLDENGVIYITGEENGNVVTEKYLNSSTRIWRKLFPNIGYDKGMDITISSDLNVIITGYANNQESGLSDFIIIKYDNLNEGNILWSKITGDIFYDDQSFGITTDGSGNCYVTGVMLQVEMEFLNNYICKLAERKFQNEREKTLHSRTKNYHSQRTS